ncbi:hypothetical protein ANO14919_096470 [Xylariales sp. No.14919]|nr:hypothetical protein ANO14919_096470 [Xylariales sp. No.14919]
MPSSTTSYTAIKQGSFSRCGAPGYHILGHVNGIIKLEPDLLPLTACTALLNPTVESSMTLFWAPVPV